MTSSFSPVIAISGAVAAGKSTLVSNLRNTLAFSVVTSGSMIASYHPEATGDREAMLAAGSNLDIQTNGKWIADTVYRHIQDSSNHRVIIDSVKTKSQLQHLKAQFDKSGFGHVYLWAEFETLKSRFVERARHLDLGVEYGDVFEDGIEVEARNLMDCADLVVKTDDVTPAKVRELVIEFVQINKL